MIPKRLLHSRRCQCIDALPWKTLHGALAIDQHSIGAKPIQSSGFLSLPDFFRCQETPVRKHDGLRVPLCSEHSLELILVLRDQPKRSINRVVRQNVDRAI